MEKIINKLEEMYEFSEAGALRIIFMVKPNNKMNSNIDRITAYLDKLEGYDVVDAKLKDSMKKLWYAFSLPIKKGVEFFIKNYKEDIDDILDKTIEELAPKIVKQIINEEITEDLHEYAKKNKLTIEQIPKAIKKEIIKRTHDEKEHEVTEESIIRAGRLVISKLNVKRMVKEIKHLIKKHGWKIGLLAGMIEMVEHVVIPGIITAIGYPTLGITFASLPWGETIIYPLLFAKLLKGEKMPSIFKKPSQDGNIDWFCKHFPEERLCKESYTKSNTIL